MEQEKWGRGKRKGMTKELSLLGMGVLAGGGLAIFSDFLRVFRRGSKQRDFFVFMEDISYWMFVGFFLFFLLEKYNKGVLRLYMFWGVAIGALLYCLVLHSLFFFCFSFIFQVVNKMLFLCGKLARKISFFVKKMLILPLKNIMKKITIMLRHV